MTTHLKPFLLSIGWLMGLALLAQVQVVPKKKMIYPGEPLPVTIRIYGPGITAARISDSLGMFDVLQKDSTTRRTADSGWIIEQHLIITGYQVGRWVLPPVFAEDAGILASKPDTITIQPLPTDSLRAYTDIRSYNPAPTWPAATIGWVLAGIAAVSGCCLYFLLRRRGATHIPAPTTIGNAEAWQRQWKRLEQQWQTQQLSQSEAAAFQLSLIRALFALLGTAPGSYTGSELVRLAQPSWPPHHWQVLQQLVSQVYSILFAGQQLSSPEILASIQKLGTLASEMLNTQTSIATNS